ncbi:hypothetical protein KIW84_044695 [Lathyrus oleraceus]|uniref:Retrovirus-related Pol polyprotein from transposon TNT 1-94-like beta-barrel domain-containing protein n=1 Tax=Pisum sativum TaxID=3888 RepID=A0A9D4XGR9_PEA|nr:hypothetical protein KIW84_044695 [Pisum sativum]
MTGQKIWLLDFNELKKRRVKLSDNSSLQVEGTDNIVIQRSNGAKALTKDVLYVPGMKCNLLIIGQLFEKGFSVVMKDGALEIFDIHNNLVLKYPLSKNRIFKTMISSTEVAQSTDHSRYGNCPQCPKPKKENQSGGKVFALSGSETSADDRLIRGTAD